MAPSGRTITAATTTTTTTTKRRTARRRIRHPRRTNFKKEEQKKRVKKKEEKMKNVLPSVMSSEDSSSKTGEIVENIAEVIDDANNNSVCSTPKGQRFRIPEISTCPPAPKKNRVMTSSNCSLRRSPLSFFSHPDLDLFFFMALGDVSV